MVNYHNNDRVVLTTTLESDTNTTYHITMPSGFISSNCYIVSCMVDIGDNNVGVISNGNWIMIFLYKNEIQYSIKDSGIFGKKMIIVLQKYN